MKIVYLGNFAPPNSRFGFCPNAVYISKTLESLGNDVLLVDEASTTSDQLLRLVDQYKPDFLLTEEANLKDDNFGSIMQKMHIPIVAWLTNIFFTIMQREIALTTNPIFKADIVFSTDGGHQKEFEALGINHHLLRQGIFQNETELGDPTYPTTAEIGFIGSVYEDIWAYRKRMVDFLQNTYKDRFKHFGQMGEIRHRPLNNLLATLKIVVGDSVYSPHYWSNRIYEVIGRGGFLITPMVDGLDEEFTPGVHFVPYRLGDFEGLKRKIDYYLEHEDEREKIRLAGWNYCKEHYTYKKRVEEMLRVLKEKQII